MPGQWTSIETNFPTFTGKEPVTEKITQLHNYMRILTDQLKYNLANLGTENWNAHALKQLTEDTSSEAAKAIAKDIEDIASKFSQLTASVANLRSTVDSASARISLVEQALNEEGQIQSRIRKLEEDAAYTEIHIDEAVARIADTEDSVAVLQADVSEMDRVLAELEKAVGGLVGAVAVDDTGTTIGGEGQTVRLVGQVYINGVLYGQEQEAEA